MSNSEQHASTNPQYKGIIDTHCHLDFNAFDPDRDQIIAQAIALGFERIIIPGTRARDLSSLFQVADTSDLIRVAAGLHPYFLKQHALSDLDLVGSYLNRSNLVAVGECGLDFYEKEHDAKQQWVLFEAHVQLAKQYRLPMILHNRKAHDEMASFLQQQRFDQGGIIHAFTGSAQQAKRYMDLGFCLGIGGSITYPRAQKVHRMVQSLPREAIVLETDAPDMPLYGYQGERNSPLQLVKVAERLSELTGVSVKEWIAQTRHNAVRVLPKLQD